ncbi:MAG: single-stranded DNA-binding protein [Propionibacteriaceae bacterium]|nr:single-stranded DNA-binding protein [Propionibacteriaceae bacterium]
MDTQIAMTGRVGSEVDHRIVKEIAYANFRLGCTPRVNRRGEWSDQETIWISVHCSRSLADGISASLKKGDPVVVTGKLRNSKWTDSEGNIRQDLRLEASSVGHDLSLGTTTFTKRPTKTRDAEAGSDETYLD